jgi:hypothetical protein
VIRSGSSGLWKPGQALFRKKPEPNVASVRQGQSASIGQGLMGLFLLLAFPPFPETPPGFSGFLSLQHSDQV